MHSNVWEWVEDDWHDSYKGAPDVGYAWVDNPIGSDRVICSGGCYNDAHYCRSASRSYFWPGARRDYVGFRFSMYVVIDP